MPREFKRTLEVDGSFNFRDIGNYHARDGYTTRAGVLYRSGALQDLRTVSAMGIHTVIDLRGDSDILRDGGTVPEREGVLRLSIPLIPARVGEQSGHEYLNDRFGPGICAERYAGYLEIGEKNLRDVFRSFTSPDVFPAVVHCTAGKDRTGVVIALILDLLGVSHASIVNDYEISNASMPDLVAHLRGKHVSNVDVSESDLARFGAPRHAMEGFLAHVHREHGSTRKLLSNIGVEESVFNLIETVLLEAKD